MVKFKEYNTSDTVVEFVARNEDFPTISCSLLLLSLVVFSISPKFRVRVTTTSTALLSLISLDYC